MAELSGPKPRATRLHLDINGPCPHIRIRLLTAANKFTRLTRVELRDFCNKDATDVVQFLESKPFLHSILIESPGSNLFSRTTPALPRLRTLRIHGLSRPFRHGLVDFLVSYGDQLQLVFVVIKNAPRDPSGDLYIGVELNHNKNNSMTDHDESENDVDEDNSNLNYREKAEKMAKLYKTYPPFVGTLAAHFLSITNIHSVKMEVDEQGPITSPFLRDHDSIRKKPCRMRLSGHCSCCTTPSEVSPCKAGTNFGRYIGKGYATVTRTNSSTSSTTANISKQYSMPFMNIDFVISIYERDFILIPPVCSLFNHFMPMPVTVTSCIPTAARLEALLDNDCSFGPDHVSELHALELAPTFHESESDFNCGSMDFTSNVGRPNMGPLLTSLLRNAAPSVRVLRVGGVGGQISSFFEGTSLLMRVITALPNVTVLYLSTQFLISAFTRLSFENSDDDVSFIGSQFLRAARNVRAIEIFDVQSCQYEFVCVLPALLTALGSTSPNLYKIIIQDQRFKYHDWDDWDALLGRGIEISRLEDALQDFQRERRAVCVRSVESLVELFKEYVID